MKILMVEDNQTLCEMMAMFFKKEKWEADYAQDGVKAVEMFKKDPTGWDIVLLDLNLPKMDGMQVAAEMRKISPTVPIIMLTARDSESDQVLGLEMGADEYVT
ncbi:response regulator, partial [Limosilactobacillus mucosae]|nr:response regulator [Limosilactobacillus mucosae]